MPVQLVPANLVIRRVDGRRDLACGKVVSHDGQWILHCHVHARYARRDVGAWGVRVPLLYWARTHGVEKIVLYVAGPPAETFSATVAVIEGLGTLGRDDQYGSTINLPREHWKSLPGRLPLPFVPDAVRYVLPPEFRAAPAREPRRVLEQADPPRQAALF